MNEQRRQYERELVRPTWAPPSWLFGPVWTFLYCLMAISFGYVAYQIYLGSVPTMLLVPIVLNLIFNFAFTPIQFGLKNNLLAFLDVLLVVATLLWAMVVIYPYVAWAAWLLVPYLLWSSFATVLQGIITYLNR